MLGYNIQQCAIVSYSSKREGDGAPNAAPNAHSFHSIENNVLGHLQYRNFPVVYMSQDTIAKKYPLQRCIYHRDLKPIILLQGTAAAVQDPHRARKIPAAAALRAPSTMMVSATQHMNSKRQQSRVSSKQRPPHKRGLHRRPSAQDP